MKKALIYIAMAGLLFMPSCVHELVPADRIVWKGTGTTLKLNAKISDSPKTKATERPGDDDGNYNENKVYTLDYFIFNVDPAANKSTEAVIQGRFTFDGEISSQSVDVSEKFDETHNKCYVYTIANLPDKNTSPLNYFEINANGKLQHVVVSSQTTTTVLTGNYETLQAIEVVTDFKNSLEGGQFKAQKSFVMSGLSQEVTLAGDGNDVADVDLSRIASKISLNINVIKMIQQYSTNNTTQTEDYQGTWFPNVDHIQVYLNYANRAGLVSGAYEGRKYENYSYFSYNRNAYISSVDPDGSYTTTSLARYNNDPSSPYYCNGNEDLIGSIYVDTQGNPVFIDGTTYPAFEVTGSPFYSYPTSWKTSDATAPFIKIIIPWVEYTIPAYYRTLSPGSEDYNAILDAVRGFPESCELSYTTGGTTYNVTATRTTADVDAPRFGEEFYYKISVPAFLEEESSECALQANNWYMINLDVAVLGSETDDAAMTIDGSQMGIYVVDWSNPEDMIGGDLDGGRYLSTAKEKYVINGINSLDIPVISSHKLSITGYGGTGNPTATYWTRSGGADAGSLTWNNTGDTGFTITATANTKVTLSHRLVPFNTSFTTANAKDIAKITYKFRIRHSDNAAYYKDIIVEQYPSIYVETRNSAQYSVFVNRTGGRTGGTAYNNHGNNTNNSLGQISTTTSYSTNFTIVSVSSLAGLVATDVEPYKSWVIGEPRIKLKDAYLTDGNVKYYIDKYNNATTNRWLQDDLGVPPEYFDNYLVGDRDASNFISPKFMLASGRGWNQGIRPWKGMAERCASYQEDGYPAGRWRLPTEAEILFCRLLGEKNLIENPFDSTIGYFATSGNYITNSGSFTHDTGNHSVRCVYDLWYWGDDPVPGVSGTYTVMLPE
ncbi:MAG: hypothetical protein IKQ01_01180 [Bacteroidales bacterium]|nr:hypothetical protein [Bacteroidales bacterium]